MILQRNAAAADDPNSNGRHFELPLGQALRFRDAPGRNAAQKLKRLPSDANKIRAVSYSFSAR